MLSRRTFLGFVAGSTAAPGLTSAQPVSQKLALAVENADAIAAVDGIDVLHIGASDLSTEMGIPGQYTHERMRSAFETVARAAKGHGNAMGVGGVRQDFEFQSWLLRLGVRYLTGGSDVGYILSAGRADVKQLRELKL
jgi:2-keto-3-deoxy-L-rhamnonate aldolase RhmA